LNGFLNEAVQDWVTYIFGNPKRTPLIKAMFNK